MKEPLVVLRLRKVGKAVKHRIASRAEELGVTPSQLSVLWRLFEQDGVLTSSLIESTGLDGGTITGVIDRLERKKFVRRERGAEDRRVVRVFLTDAGRKLQEPLRAIIASLDELAIAGWEAEDVRRFVELLDRLGENLHAE